MPQASCPSCGAHYPGGAPATCQRCHKPIAAAAPYGGLDLKEVLSCTHCKFEGYEEDLQDGLCPRCQRPVEGEEDDGEDGDDASESRRGPPRRRSKIGSRAPRGRGKKKKKSASRAERKEPAKKQIELTTDFKQRVIGALGRGDPKTAQQLCFEYVGEKEEHAKQVYSYLLGLAKKRGAIGGPKPPSAEVPSILDAADAPGASGQVQRVQVPPPSSASGEVVWPSSILDSGSSASGDFLTSSEALPLPPGLLDAGQTPQDPQGHGYQPGPHDPQAHGYQPGPPAPQAYGQPAAPQDAAYGQAPPQAFGAPGAEPFAPAADPPPQGFAAHSAPPAPQPAAPPPPGVPQGATPAQGVPRGAPPAQNLPRGAAPPPGVRQAAPSRTPERPAEPAEPEERGFLGRVALEGRAAQATLLCQAGHFAAARDVAQSALARDPGASRCHSALGEALAGLGQDGAALQAYANGVRADPKDPVAIRGYAQMLGRLGRHADAAAAYRRLVQAGRGSDADAVALATALRRAGDAQGAQRVFAEIAQRDPQSLEPLRQEAEARASAGDPQGAAELVERLFAREEPPYPLTFSLAETLAGRSRDSLALALACSRVLLAASRPLAAVRVLVPHLPREARHVEVRRNLGLAYARLGAGTLAEEQLVAVVQQGAAGVEELQALGEVYLERGEPAAAAQALVRARDARPDDPGVRRTLARALVLQGEVEAAIRELRSAHDREEGARADLEEELDRLLERSLHQRIKDLKARLLAGDGDGRTRLDLAEALTHMGDLHEALPHIEEAGQEPTARRDAVALCERLLEQLEGEQRELSLLLARLEDAGGKTARAIEVVEELLAAHPDDPELQVALFGYYARGHRVQDAVVGLRAFLEDAPPGYLAPAVALAERMVEEQGYHGLALSVARGRRRMGDAEGAIANYERYLESEPEDQEVRRELAHLLESSGRHADAYATLLPLVEGAQATLGELERVAALALAAGEVEKGVDLLRRACERHPDDLPLKHALEAALAVLRDREIAALQGATGREERVRLAGLYAEAGRRQEAMQVLGELGRLGDRPELGYVRFCGEHFARHGQVARAEEVMREMAQTLGYADGSEQKNALLYRLAGLYERAGERRQARRLYLEIHARDPGYADLQAKLDALDDELAPQAGRPDGRVLDLVDVGASGGTVFEALQGLDLGIDPRLLARTQG